MTSRSLLAVRTAAHLRPRQIVARLIRNARGLAGGPRLRHPRCAPTLHRGVSNLATCLAERFETESFAPLVQRARNLRDGTFQAVGESISVEEIDWTTRPRSHLFTYHLHYFDDAPALAALAHQGDRSATARLRALWESWLDACGSGSGDGWDPYPIASRIPNWIRALAMLTGVPEPGCRIPDPLRDRILSSLWTQADRLGRTLEYDLAGNHLLRNRFALVWAAAALDPPPVDLDRMSEDLDRELRRQVLRDGMHEERTPAYHALALHDLLEGIEVLRAVDAPVPGGLRIRAERMEHALRCFVRSDGALHPFGDTTPRGYPSPAMLERLARDVLGPISTSPMSSPWHLGEAGYAGIRTDELEVVLDCGPFGARHQPGHGHCDGLSFILSFRGVPIVVDPGVAGYAGDPLRHWARGTAAHNTVQIDGREQTEIWDVFRAARRAREGRGEVRVVDGVVHLRGSLSPWHAPRVRHERLLTLGGDTLEVRDTVRGARGRWLDTRLHFPPGTQVDPQTTARVDDSAACWTIRCGNEHVTLEVFGVDEVVLDTGYTFPEWGRVETAPVLRGRIERATDDDRFGFRFTLSSSSHRFRTATA